MPPADWCRAFIFGHFVSATYNQRLLDVVVYYLQAALDADLEGFYAHLVAHLDDAPEGSVWSELGSVFRRFIDSVMAGGPLFLPLDGTGPTIRDVASTAVLIALARLDDFLAEAEALTRAFLEATDRLGDRLSEVFRYQRFVTPRFGDHAARDARFDHDWPAFVAAGGAPRTPHPAAVRLRWDPPSYASADELGVFAEAHLHAIRSRAATGTIATERPS
jgi:hypothetical protein